MSSSVLRRFTTPLFSKRASLLFLLFAAALGTSGPWGLVANANDGLAAGEISHAARAIEASALDAAALAPFSLSAREGAFLAAWAETIDGKPVLRLAELDAQADRVGPVDKIDGPVSLPEALAATNLSARTRIIAWSDTAGVTVLGPGAPALTLDFVPASTVKVEAISGSRVAVAWKAGSEVRLALVEVTEHQLSLASDVITISSDGDLLDARMRGSEIVMAETARLHVLNTSDGFQRADVQQVPGILGLTDAGTVLRSDDVVGLRDHEAGSFRAIPTSQGARNLTIAHADDHDAIAWTSVNGSIFLWRSTAPSKSLQLRAPDGADISGLELAVSNGSGVVSWLETRNGITERLLLGLPGIFSDDFELGNTSQWSRTVPPVNLSIESPSEGEAVAVAAPDLVVTYDAPTGLAIDPQSLAWERDGAPLATTCNTTPTGAACAPDADFADGSVTVSATVQDVEGGSSPMQASEHRSNKQRKNWDKHTKPRPGDPEKGDAARRPPRKKPPGHKGPWPPKGK